MKKEIIIGILIVLSIGSGIFGLSQYNKVVHLEKLTKELIEKNEIQVAISVEQAARAVNAEAESIEYEKKIKVLTERLVAEEVQSSK